MKSISVIIPAFNAQLYIKAAIKSVLCQTLKPAELIIVDDGSTDRTVEIAEATAETAPFPVALLKQPNRGLPTARNVGIARSIGEWIAFLDADDIWRPEHLATFDQTVNISDFSVYFSDVFVFRSEDAISGPPTVRPRCVRVGSAISDQTWDMGPHVFEEVVAGNFIPVSSTLIRREVGDSEGWFDPFVKKGSDRDLFLRLALRTRFQFCDQVTAGLRMHAANMSGGPQNDRGEYILHAFRALHRPPYVDRLNSSQQQALTLAYRRQITAHLYAASGVGLKALFSAYRSAARRPFYLEALNPRHLVRLAASGFRG